MGQNLKIIFIFSHLKKLPLYVVLQVYNFRRKEIFNAFIKISLSRSIPSLVKDLSALDISFGPKALPQIKLLQTLHYSQGCYLLSIFCINNSKQFRWPLLVHNQYLVDRSFQISWFGHGRGHFHSQHNGISCDPEATCSRVLQLDATSNNCLF